MQIRLLALDVDGTLLDTRGQVRPRVERALGAARERGCAIVLATGRRLQSVEPIARRLDIRFLILVDGGVIYDRERGEAIYEQTIDPIGLRRGISLAREHTLGPILFESPAAHGRILVGPADLDTPEIATYLGRRPEVARLAFDELELQERVIGMIAMGRREAVERAGEAARAEGRWAVVVWEPSRNGYQADTLSLSPPGTSKGAAFRWLADRLGVTRPETMAVGDYHNDVSLVAGAGRGIAMGNAVAAVRAVARAVVADNDNDGVAEAIEAEILRTSPP